MAPWIFAAFTQHTHIKANANTKKQVKEQIPAAARHYAKELMEEVNADREAHGKKPFDDDNDPPASPRKHKDNTSKKKLARRKKQGFRTVTKSTTDPDCGLFVKGAFSYTPLSKRRAKSLLLVALLNRALMSFRLFVVVDPN